MNRWNKRFWWIFLGNHLPSLGSLISKPIKEAWKSINEHILVLPPTNCYQVHAIKPIFGGVAKSKVLGFQKAGQVSPMSWDGIAQVAKIHLHSHLIYTWHDDVSDKHQEVARWDVTTQLKQMQCPRFCPILEELSQALPPPPPPPWNILKWLLTPQSSTGWNQILEMNMKNMWICLIMIMEIKIGLQEPSMDMYVGRQDSIHIDCKKSNGNEGKTS
jgi:hypothetical protein